MRQEDKQEGEGACADHAATLEAPRATVNLRKKDGTAPGFAAGQVNGISSTCRLKAGRAAMRAYQASSAGMAGRSSISVSQR